MNVCKTLGMLAIALLVSTSHCAAMTATEIVYDTVGDNDIANAILYYCEQNGVDPLLATATFETEAVLIKLLFLVLVLLVLLN